MKSIFKDNIVCYLEKNNIIKDSQHGFRNKWLCFTNIFDFFNEVYSLYDDTKAVDIIYLEFQKAFDKVPHKPLTCKVKDYGITENPIKWIGDWLWERKQRVVINWKTSECIRVNSGVPQDSELGPILFILYINDIDEGITCKISKFHDDTKIADKVNWETQRQLMQNDVNALVDWSKKWQMNFDLEKCHVPIVGNNNLQINYSMDDVQLKNVIEKKTLVK